MPASFNSLKYNELKLAFSELPLKIAIFRGSHKLVESIDWNKAVLDIQ